MGHSLWAPKGAVPGTEHKAIAPPEGSTGNPEVGPVRQKKCIQCGGKLSGSAYWFEFCRGYTCGSCIGCTKPKKKMQEGHAGSSVSFEGVLLTAVPEDDEADEAAGATRTCAQPPTGDSTPPLVSPEVVDDEVALGRKGGRRGRRICPGCGETARHRCEACSGWFSANHAERDRHKRGESDQRWCNEVEGDLLEELDGASVAEPIPDEPPELPQHGEPSGRHLPEHNTMVDALSRTDARPISPAWGLRAEPDPLRNPELGDLSSEAEWQSVRDQDDGVALRWTALSTYVWAALVLCHLTFW